MDEDKAHSILVVAALAAVASSSLTIQDGAGRLTSTATTSTPVFFIYKSETIPAYKSETTPAYKSKTMKLPILMNRTIPVVSTPTETTPAS